MRKIYSTTKIKKSQYLFVKKLTMWTNFFEIETFDKKWIFCDFESL